ncbi:uncharacterized protein J3R85_003957 [Psidium guajava]|nr:uncharacterized protein J3R85_003957 [Psidium guajava]
MQIFPPQFRHLNVPLLVAIRVHFVGALLITGIVKSSAVTRLVEHLHHYLVITQVVPDDPLAGVLHPHANMTFGSCTQLAAWRMH